MNSYRLKMTVLAALGVSLFVIAGAQAQDTAATGQADASLMGGTGIYAELNGGLDSKKAKVGDAITLHTTEAVKSTDERTILPKGTKVVGHITQSEARSKGAGESTLGLAFDKAVLKDGHELPLNVVVQAMGAPMTFSDMGGGPPADTAASGTQRTSPMGGGTRMGPPASQGPSAGVGSGASGPDTSSGPQLGPTSRGVLGLHGLTLNTTTANNAPVAVVTSDGKNVHLDSGTRFLLVAQTAEGK